MPPTKWQPSPNDTTSFAAFRWFANSIENDAMELYATDRGTYEQIEEVLRHTLKDLAALRGKLALPPGNDDCPEGWVLCNGVCAPSCDLIGGAAAPYQQK